MLTHHFNIYLKLYTYSYTSFSTSLLIKSGSLFTLSWLYCPISSSSIFSLSAWVLTYSNSELILYFALRNSISITSFCSTSPMSLFCSIMSSSYGFFWRYTSLLKCLICFLIIFNDFYLFTFSSSSLKSLPSSDMSESEKFQSIGFSP